MEETGDKKGVEDTRNMGPIPILQEAIVEYTTTLHLPTCSSTSTSLSRSLPSAAVSPSLSLLPICWLNLDKAYQNNGTMKMCNRCA